MPLKVEASAELDEILNRLEMLGSSVLPETARAVDVAAGLVLRVWVNVAQGNDLSGKPENVRFRGSAEYARSIRIRSLGAFSKLVFSDSEEGAALEKGRDEYDMKPAMVRGPKSRVAEDGHRYNIVPLRHKTAELKKKENRLPEGQNAYAAAKQLVKQRIIGFKIDNEGKRRLAYAAWTKEKQLDTASSRLAGMVRMETSTGKASSSIYLTFRVVHLGQTGKWILPAQDKWAITKEVYDKTKDAVEKIITGGVKRDLGVE